MSLDKGWVDDDEFDVVGAIENVRRMPNRPGPDNLYDLGLELASEWGDGWKCWRDDFYLNEASHWQQQDRNDVLRRLNAVLGESTYTKTNKAGKPFPAKWPVGPASLNAVLQQIGFQVNRPRNLEPDFGKYIYLENGRWDVNKREYVAGAGDEFNTHASPVRWVEGADCPLFRRLLMDSFGGDDGAVARHLTAMAAELVRVPEMQRAYFLKGETASGKSTMMEVGTALVGVEQVVSSSFTKFGSEFGRAAMVGKSVVRVPDVRNVGKDPMAVLEGLLTVIGNDLVSVDRKGIPDWTGRLNVMVTLCGNVLPRVLDGSGALLRRFAFNSTVGSRLGKEEFGLADHIIDTELEGVLKLVLGHAHLVRGAWPETKASIEVRAEMEKLIQPLAGWLEEGEVVFDPDAKIQCSELYQNYVGWTKSAGLKAADVMDIRAFGSALKEHPVTPYGPVTCEVLRKQRRVEGEIKWHYIGVRLSDGSEEDLV